MLYSLVFVHVMMDTKVLLYFKSFIYSYNIAKEAIFINFQSWWQYINIEKLFITKLMKVLQQGGNGNAVAIYPHLLPLLSNLPFAVIDPNTFYVNFFENMKTG